MAEPPQSVARDEIPPRDYVFVVDVSGSMFGFPLDTAKKLLSDLVNVLRPTDTFNLVVFESGFEVFSPVSVPATTVNLRRGLQFIGTKNGGGGTRLLNGLQRAVQLPREPGLARSVVLLTDGYIDAEADVFDYIREHRDDANFFAFGIGSSVNRYLIEGIARAGLGEPFIVTKPDDAPEAAEQLRRYIETPVLTDIDVRFAGFDVYDVEPGKIPDLFASRPIVVFGKWRGAIGGSIEISGRTGRGAYQTSIPVVPATADATHAALRHLWARTRIANLSDFGPATPSQDRIGEITSLGLTYSLLTKYTSFIAVHEVVRRVSDGADDVDQPLPLPEGVSDRAVGVTSGAEPELIWVMAVAIALLGSHAPAARAARRLVTPRLASRGGEDDMSGVLAVVALMAYGLKRHYADASTDALSWILTPTAQLVSLVTGVAFTAVPGEGYFSAERMFLIEKACAGVNFMIAAFAMVAFALLHRARTVRARRGGHRRESAGELCGRRPRQHGAHRHRDVARGSPDRMVVADASRHPSSRRNHGVLRRPDAALRAGAENRSWWSSVQIRAAARLLLPGHAGPAAREWRCTGQRCVSHARGDRPARAAGVDSPRIWCVAAVLALSAAQCLRRVESARAACRQPRGQRGDDEHGR